MEGKLGSSSGVLPDETAERLRSKHVRTLEVLQNVMEENEELREKVNQLTKGTVKLGNPAHDNSSAILQLQEQLKREQAQQQAQLVEMEKKFETKKMELEAQVNEKTTENQKLYRRMLDLDKKHQEMKKSLEGINATTLEKIQSSEEELETLRQHLAQQKGLQNQDFENMQEQVKSLTDQLSQAQKQIQELVAKCHQLQTQNEEFSKQYKQICKQSDQHAQENNQLAILIKEKETLLQHQEEQSKQEIMALKNKWQISDMKLKKAMQTGIENSQLTGDVQRLTGERDALQLEVIRLSNELRRSSQASSTPQQPSPLHVFQPNAQGKVSFAQHIDLKRENHQLRAQIEEMKEAQKRYLGSTKKKTLTFERVNG